MLGPLCWKSWQADNGNGSRKLHLPESKVSNGKTASDALSVLQAHDPFYSFLLLTVENLIILKVIIPFRGILEIIKV